MANVLSDLEAAEQNLTEKREAARNALIANVETMKGNYLAALEELGRHFPEERAKLEGGKIKKSKGQSAAIGITDSEINTFIELRGQGLSLDDIKLHLKGRRQKTIDKLEEAYKKGKTPSAMRAFIDGKAIEEAPKAEAKPILKKKGK